MKIAKILSAAAACAVAATALAVSASAELVVVDSPAAHLSSATGMWMVKVYCPSENIDLGIDLAQIGGVRFTISADEPEWFEGATGGGIVISCGPTSVTPEDHNWVSKGFWGVTDDDKEIYSQDEAADIKLVTAGDYTYTATLMLDDSTSIYPDLLTGNADAYVQIALQEWGSDMSAMKVDSMELLDASGNVLATFDANGNMTTSAAPAPSTPSEPSDTTTTPSTPSTSTGDKGSPDTGVAGVAAAAGVAALAAGAVVLTKKRK